MHLHETDILIFLFIHMIRTKPKQNIFFSKKHICSKCILLHLYVRVFLEPNIHGVYCLYVRLYMYLGYLGPSVYEPRHDKTNKMAVRPAKTQTSLGIRPV